MPAGHLIDYAGGRSNGCTSWTATDAQWIIPLVESNPTTLYIYPESRDVTAVARAATDGRLASKGDLYWNTACLSEIGAPRFWSDDELGPLIARYEASHPAAAPRPLPVCNSP